MKPGYEGYEKYCVDQLNQLPENQRWEALAAEDSNCFGGNELTSVDAGEPEYNCDDGDDVPIYTGVNDRDSLGFSEHKCCKSKPAVFDPSQKLIYWY